MNLSMHRTISTNEMFVIETAVNHKTSKRNALSPCDGCINRSRCAAQEIACPAYRVYSSNKASICPPEKWKNELRTPTARIFRCVWDD